MTWPDISPSKDSHLTEEMSLEHATPAMPIQVIVYNVYITWAVGVGPFTFIHTTILTPTLFLSYCYCEAQARVRQGKARKGKERQVWRKMKGLKA